MAEKVAGIIGLICVVFVWYNAVIKYFILKLRCTELIKGMNEQESVIGEEKEYVYNNNKYLVYEVDRKIDGINKANYVITANSKYYMAIIIGWEYLEEDPTENILSSLEY